MKIKGLVGLLLFFCLFAKATPLKITWLLADSAPFVISDLNYSRKGVCQALVEQFQLQMPTVEQELLILPQKRINNMMRQGHSVCFPCMIHQPEVSQLALFSNPTILYPPFAIAANKNNAERIVKKYGVPVDIKALLGDSSFKMGREVARRYGEILQPILDESSGFKNAVASYTSIGASSAVFTMLAKGRAEYIIDYPIQVEYQKSLGHSDLTIIPIKQVVNKFTLGAVGCSANAPDNFATKAIEKINHALTDNILKEEGYRNILNRWMKGAIENYPQLYEKEVVNFLKGSNN